MNTPPVIPSVAVPRRVITYELTRWDVFMNWMTTALRSRILQVFILAALILNGWLVLAPGIASRPLTRIVFDAGVYLICFVGFLAVVQCMLGLANAFLLKQRGVVGRHSLEITEQGLVERTDFNETLHRWPDGNEQQQNEPYSMEHHNLRRDFAWRPWLRWVLVLPAAVAGYFAAAFAMGVIFGSVARSWDSEYSDFPNPSFKLALLRFAIEPTAFVYAGALTAPSRRFLVSVVLSILLAGFILFAFVRATQTRGFDWAYTLSTGIELLVLTGSCIHFYRGWHG